MMSALAQQNSTPAGKMAPERGQKTPSKAPAKKKPG
jgi:hypothetical protein